MIEDVRENPTAVSEHKQPALKVKETIEEATAVITSSFECVAACCLPCLLACPGRLQTASQKLMDNKTEIMRGVNFLLTLWTIIALWIQQLQYHIPDYQVGSTSEGDEAYLYRYSMYLGERAIIFSPEDVQRQMMLTNSSATNFAYVASGQCRTFSGCLYDGPIYPTKDGDFYQFGGNRNPVIQMAIWLALVVITIALLGLFADKEIFGQSIPNKVYNALKKCRLLARQLRLDNYKESDIEVFWSFIKFWFLSFCNCALTLPVGTSKVDGCLEASGFFQLRHLIFVSYVFILSTAGFIFLMMLFLCNIKCYDEQLGLGRITCDLYNMQIVQEYQEDDEESKESKRPRIFCCLAGRKRSSTTVRRAKTLFTEAVGNVVHKGISEPLRCCCLWCEFESFFTVRVYLEIVIGTLAFFGFLVIMVSWLSGLMAIINGVVSSPWLNIPQILYWWFDLARYVFAQKKEDIETGDHDEQANFVDEDIEGGSQASTPYVTELVAADIKRDPQLDTAHVTEVDAAEIKREPHAAEIDVALSPVLL